MNWLKYRPIYFFLSALILIPGIWSLATFGFKLGVDFTGGSHITWEAGDDRFKAAVTEAVPEAKVNQTDDKLNVETKPLTQKELDEVQNQLKEAGYEPNLLSFVTVGPSAGNLLLRQTLTAAALATVGILLYVSSAFKSFKFGLAAVLAMFHDTLVLLGSFSLLGRFAGVQVDLLFVTALLTTLSFSVHDTIVLFDRIRELARKKAGEEFETIANKAITDTMIRSLNNSMTIIFMLLALVFLGGETIRPFALALLIGAVTGTYSSPFVAVPLLSLWETAQKKLRKSF